MKAVSQGGGSAGSSLRVENVCEKTVVRRAHRSRLTRSEPAVQHNGLAVNKTRSCARAPVGRLCPRTMLPSGKCKRSQDCHRGAGLQGRCFREGTAHAADAGIVEDKIGPIEVRRGGTNRDCNVGFPQAAVPACRATTFLLICGFLIIDGMRRTRNKLPMSAAGFCGVRSWPGAHHPGPAACLQDCAQGVRTRGDLSSARLG